MIKADSLMCISPEYHSSGKAIKPRSQRVVSGNEFP